MTSYDFAISGQHYLFDVRSFAHHPGGRRRPPPLLDRDPGRHRDMASGAAELGVIMQTSETEAP